VKETGVVVTASWYNLEHTLGLTSPQPSCAQHAIGHCLPLTGLHPSGPRGDRCCYSTWTRYTKPTHKRSQNTALVTRNNRKSNQELLPLTASNQGNVPPRQQRSNLSCRGTCIRLQVPRSVFIQPKSDSLHKGKVA
jgi:hypothetical protein